ncbi:hypothetical protein [Aquimarina intermedia]|uniref:Uncharacterized protein n=1 Tax=Aquimarina intermedia TaxID=350814 RepID=A0A5S5BWC8_9FLAO|nr:hypothetical protein [Aquimarina intermedia]TYP71491.1 hypothetical protein BD809_10973 [Aquimarina intermedia]
MQVDIYINEEKMDTDVSTTIAETKQINDFFEIKDRQTSYTNSFNLPKSERNIEILSGMGLIGNTSLAPYRVHKVSIYRNGIQTVHDGIGIFKDSAEGFKVHVYNENIDLFDVIGNKSISDLKRIQQLSHTLNTTNWINSFGRNDYIYAIADYGKTDGETIEVDYQVPSLFVKYIWESIFLESGFHFRYVGRAGQSDYNPFNKKEWSELAITIDEGLAKNENTAPRVKKLEIGIDKVSQYTGETINFLGQTIVVQELIDEITEYVRFTTKEDPDNMHLYSTSVQYNRSRIRIQEEGYYIFNLRGQFSNLNTENVSLFIEKDGHDLFTIKDDFPDQGSNVNFEQKLFLQKGDELFVKVISLPVDNESFYSYNLTLTMYLDNTVATVNFSSFLTKLKQKDFIKDILNFYGLMFRRKGKTYELISYEELLDPTAVYLNQYKIKTSDVLEDWSSKFHKVVGTSYQVGNYAQNNLFKYRYDNSENTFADSQIKIDDHTLENEKTLIERVYRAPERSSLFVAFTNLFKCSFYQKEFDEDGKLKTVKPQKVEPYFFRVKRVAASITYKLSDSSGSNFYANSSVPFMDFEELDFNSTVATKYTAFSNMVNYGKKHKALLYLNVIDIHRMDFFKLKYIKQLGGIFYVNKIPNFTGEDKTTVEIIRVRSYEKLGQFSDDFNDDFNN